MEETLHQPPMPALPPQGRRSRWGQAHTAFLLFTVLTCGIGLAARMAIRDQPVAGVHAHEDRARLLRERRSGTHVGSPAEALKEILALPDVIPTHNHPLLGRQAPGFELADLEGKSWNLRDLLAGGPVVLVFHHSYCELCVRQLFDDDTDLPLFREVGAQLVAISADPPELTQRRIEQYGPVGFPILADPGNKVAQAYQVFRRTQDGKMAERLLHGTFVIDRGGMVLWVNVGDGPFRRNRALLYQLAKIEGRLPSVPPEP